MVFLYSFRICEKQCAEDSCLRTTVRAISSASGCFGVLGQIINFAINLISPKKKKKPFPISIHVKRTFLPLICTPIMI